jgi:hypothetical protein
MRDPRNLLVPAVGGGDETILRDLKFTLAKNAGIGWLNNAVLNNMMAAKPLKPACSTLLIRDFPSLVVRGNEDKGEGEDYQTRAKRCRTFSLPLGDGDVVGRQPRAVWIREFHQSRKLYFLITLIRADYRRGDHLALAE